MKRSYLQILGAFFLGLLIPGMLLSVGEVLREAAVSIPSTGSAPEKSEQEVQRMILVQMEEGTEQMELETYLVEVVLAEMPASFEEAALQAQAMVARTYALKRQQLKDHHSNGAVCTSALCCQDHITVEDYLERVGTQEDVEKVVAAVRQTAGQVVIYEGELIEATYFSCSGGRTEDAVAVWGGAYPYLRSVDSPGEEMAECYEEVKVFTRSQLEEALGTRLSGTAQNWIDWCTYTAGNGVDKLCLAGQIYKGTQLRQLLGLRSTMFSVCAVEDGLKVTTYGCGHRVGMSQWGAEAMAINGSTVAEILSHYYPGTLLETLTSD